jgi:hypothetical protein
LTGILTIALVTAAAADPASNTGAIPPVTLDTTALTPRVVPPTIAAFLSVVHPATIQAEARTTSQ